MSRWFCRLHWVINVLNEALITTLPMTVAKFHLPVNWFSVKTSLGKYEVFFRQNNLRGIQFTPISYPPYFSSVHSSLSAQWTVRKRVKTVCLIHPRFYCLLLHSQFVFVSSIQSVPPARLSIEPFRALMVTLPFLILCAIFYFRCFIYCGENPIKLALLFYTQRLISNALLISYTEIRDALDGFWQKIRYDSLLNLSHCLMQLIT